MKYLCIHNQDTVSPARFEIASHCLSFHTSDLNQVQISVTCIPVDVSRVPAFKRTERLVALKGNKGDDKIPTTSTTPL